MAWEEAHTQEPNREYLGSHPKAIQVTSEIVLLVPHELGSFERVPNTRQAI